MKNLFKLISLIIICELVGIFGATFTINSIPAWYVNLNKPNFAPPNWVFGPAWTILYFLMAVSFYLVLRQSKKKKLLKSAKVFFFAQLILNFLWTPIFFGLKSPALGLVIIVAMWFLIILTMKKFYLISKLAFYLLVPYILWVSFASVLNAAILVLN